MSDLTPSQCKMARAALGMSVKELAALAQVSTNTVGRFEANEDLRPRTIKALKLALETRGCMFLEPDEDGPGVRVKCHA